MFPGICKWYNAGLPSLVAQTRGWVANARGAAWDRNRAPGACGVSPQWGAAPGASRLRSETARGWAAGVLVAASTRIPLALGLCGGSTIFFACFVFD